MACPRIKAPRFVRYTALSFFGASHAPTGSINVCRSALAREYRRLGSSDTPRYRSSRASHAPTGSINVCRSALARDKGRRTFKHIKKRSAAQPIAGKRAPTHSCSHRLLAPLWISCLLNAAPHTNQCFQAFVRKTTRLTYGFYWFLIVDKQSTVNIHHP